MEINCSCTALGHTKKCLDCLGSLKVEAKRGMAVYYVPKHARYESSRGFTMPVYAEKGVERGFITSVSEEFVFCRYFSSLTPSSELRTKANSEPTSPEDLWRSSTSKSGQEKIDRLLEEL